MKKEHGRSMVEMLGTLAIIGVLSVTALTGYKIAMTKNRVNNIVHDVFLAVESVNSISTFDQIPYNDTPVTNIGVRTPFNIYYGADYLDEFFIKISGLNQDVCKYLSNFDNEYIFITDINNVQGGGDCIEGDNNIIRFNFTYPALPNVVLNDKETAVRCQDDQVSVGGECCDSDKFCGGTCCDGTCEDGKCCATLSNRKVCCDNGKNPICIARKITSCLCCDADEYICAGNMDPPYCRKCDERVVCDGKGGKVCAPGYVHILTNMHDECCHESNEYFVEYYGCKTCPKGAICDGTQNVTCTGSQTWDVDFERCSYSGGAA